MANGHKKRYLVVNGSQSCHCCFEATVVDTEKPRRRFREEDEQTYEEVCECFYVEDARRIEAALNGEI